MTRSELNGWRKLRLDSLDKMVMRMGGRLRVTAVFEDGEIPVVPAPASPPPVKIDAPETTLVVEAEQQSTTVVAPGENECQRLPVTLNRQPPELSNSEILRMWRERGF